MAEDKKTDPLKTKVVGEHPETIIISTPYLPNEDYLAEHDKVQDLRYGTNPSQTAALYNHDSFLGSLEELKTGKQGPSQTNMEDILYAAWITGFFEDPSVIVMKHENPSGFATQYEPEPLGLTYKKARDADFRAAFGGTVLFNRPIDKETAEAVHEIFTEALVAPDYDDGVVSTFKGSTRIFKYDDKQFKAIPRYVDDKSEPEIKMLRDGSIIRSDPLLTPIRTAEDLRQYVASKIQPSEYELKDLLTGYRIILRSNSIRMVKEGYTTGLGTGQQDRIMCMKIAAFKSNELEDLAAEEGYERAAHYNIPGSVLVSDAFFPFTDCIEYADELGITAILAPHGGDRFDEVLAKANEYEIAYVDLPGELRFFDHH